MLRFSLLGFPVGVDWFFWLTVVLLGGGFYAKTGEDWTRVGVWVGVVFVSILVHELGHALAGRRFGASPAIRLHAFGGLTFLHGGEFTRKQSVIVSGAGPLAGFLLGAIILAMELVLRPEPALLRWAIIYGLYVNFFWTLVNLLPIQPLDGGQMLREILGASRRWISNGIGFALAALLCLWAIYVQQIFLAVFLGFLAYHNLRRQPAEGGVVKD